MNLRDETGDPLRLLRTQSLPMLMQQDIEQLILSGRLAAGERVNEVELAVRYGTSRGPVREALRALEEAGLLRQEKNRGVFVRRIGVDEAEGIYDVREALDELVGRRLARRITPAQLSALRAMLAPMDDAARRGDAEGYLALNLRFHDALVEMTGNDTLVATYRRLIKQLHLFRLRALVQGGGLPVSNDEHRAIVAAIASRDPDAAGRALRAHVRSSRRRMRRAHDAQPAAD
ncbi:MAG TPA: phosphonate utilization associated transcriptional regulator [Burkholderiaceae bacterium]|jgi:phosphonate utilization transcriptional regulator|nr:phosphonate utilization associated transcriptional regulator [Burkholderiaceae bacterium]